MPDVLSAPERARAALFDRMATRPWPKPWKRLRAPQGQTVGHTTRIDDRRLPAAYLNTELRAKADDVCALILDARDNGLAGDLLDWKAEPVDAQRQRVRYAVAMPAPFRPRAFRVIQRRAQRGVTQWLFSHDDPEANEPVPSGMVLGHVFRSDYRLTELPQGGLRFERIIAVDLSLPVPTGIFARMLGREQLADVARINVTLATARDR